MSGSKAIIREIQDMMKGKSTYQYDGKDLRVVPNGNFPQADKKKIMKFIDSEYENFKSMAKSYMNVLII